MECIKYFWLFALCTINIQASTHWMVTETGLVQPRVDSQFIMAHPNDLLAFLNQDTRWDKIINLYYDLSNRQQVVDTLWSDLEKDTDVPALLSLDENCVKVGDLNSLDWYTSFLEDGKSKGILDVEFLLYNSNYGDTDVPDCKKISSLTFSMFAFEHLDGMTKRENLTASPELSLPEQVSPIMTVDQFGHWLAAVLRKNSSSWLHYNMASLYWRVRGNAPKAIECSRRAVHYAPREYKDIALLSMGSLLHRSKMPEDAAIVLGAAADHDPFYPYNHFTLANAFAVLGDFNSSTQHFDQCLKLNPTFDLAEKHKGAVLCHKYLLHKLQAVQETLKKLREELQEYSQREADWLKCQAAFLRTMKHAEEFDYRNVEKNCEKMSELTGLNIKELKQRGDKNSLMQYFLDGPTYNEKWLKEKGVHAIESAYSLQRLVKHIGKHANMVTDFVIPREHLEAADGKLLKEIGPMPVFPDDMLSDIKGRSTIEATESKIESQKTDKRSSSSQEVDHFEFDTGKVAYPPTMKINRNLQDFDVESDWPSNRLCEEAAPNFPEKVEAIYPVFLPFENKGIRVSTLLSEMIGVPASVEHDLPWHPPTCPNDKDAAAFTQKKSQKPQFASEVVATEYLRQKLLRYVGDGDADRASHMQDAEIGQRIYAAMQMKLAPKWLLYTLSSLYWRVRGNNINALNCLLTAGRTVDTKYRDIVLASLASVYLEMGYFDESLSAAEEAFRLSLYEPATNFILAELNMLKKHRNTHMFHLKQVLRVEPGFMGGVARGLLTGWACILKQVNALQELEFSDSDICTQVEPGMSMACERDGGNCHVTHIQCFSSHERETSTIVRMLKIKDYTVQGSHIERMDESVLDEFVNSMPTDRTDKAGHQKNYDAMLTSIDNSLNGCVSRGCLNIEAEDLSLKEDECTYEHLQLGYWLHLTSFRQFLDDSDLRFPSEITAMAPSNKKVPECRLPEDLGDDFFLERITKVDTEGWEPVLSLMHQFSELFSFHDHVALGAKIARYVDAKPMSWAGLVAAGWWCGAGGRGACAARCLAAAHAHAHAHGAHALRALASLLHMQSKQQDAIDIAYLSFYTSPKSKIEALLVAVSHTYLAQYEKAIWMYRYALGFDNKFLPAKACLHANMCLMLFGENAKTKQKSNDIALKMKINLI